MNTDLESLKAATLYVAGLRAWLDSQAITFTPGDHPLGGVWTLSDGAGILELGDDGFKWHHGDPEVEATLGTYNVMPGLQTNTGFTADHGRPMTSCYSVIMHFTTHRVSAVDLPVDRHGLLFVEQLGSEDRLGVYHHATASHLTAIRE